MTETMSARRTFRVSEVGKVRTEGPWYTKVIRHVLCVTNKVIIPMPYIGYKWSSFISEGPISTFVRRHEQSQLRSEDFHVCRLGKHCGEDIYLTFSPHPPCSFTRITDKTGEEWESLN